jgi:hypothetical protein
MQIPPGRVAVKDIFEFIARLDRRGLRTLRKIALDLENCGTCYGGMH